jgi:hypothetical protein
MSVRSYDSESSDLTSYYCIDYDTRHELRSDAPPFACVVEYSSNKESIGKLGDIIPLSTTRLAQYQVYVTFDPETGVKTPAGGNTARINNDQRWDGEASGGNANTTILVSQTEWDTT